MYATSRTALAGMGELYGRRGLGDVMGMGDTTSVLTDLINQAGATIRGIFDPVPVNPNIVFPANPQLGPLNPQVGPVDPTKGYYDQAGYYHPPVQLQPPGLFSSSTVPLLLGGGVLLYLLTRGGGGRRSTPATNPRRRRRSHSRRRR